MRTYIRTFAAANAFAVIDFPHIKFAAPHANSTVRTLIRIHAHAQNGNAVKQRIERTQRAKEPAKGPVYEHAGNEDDRHHNKFPCK